MAGTLVRIGPSFLTVTMTDLYTPPAATIYTVIKHIHVNNMTKADARFNMHIADQSASGGFANGNELFGGAGSVASGQVDLDGGVLVRANESFDWTTPGLRMDSGDFLIGRAGVNYTLVYTIMVERFAV